MPFIMFLTTHTDIKVMVKDTELLAQLLSPLANNWKKICRKCGISNEEIIKIEQSSGQDNASCTSCLEKGLAMWCEKVGNSSKITLLVLIEALREVDCDGTIESKLLQNWFRLSSVVEMQRQRKGKCMDHL